jgi:hypothetical protein
VKFQEGKFGLNMHIVEPQCTLAPVNQFLSTIGTTESNTSSGVSNMGNRVFTALAADLSRHFVDKSHSVSAEEYQAWRHGYLFDALQNLRYGQSFCNAFDISDNVLFYEPDTDWANDYIQNYYVK